MHALDFLISAHSGVWRGHENDNVRPTMRETLAETAEMRTWKRVSETLINGKLATCDDETSVDGKLANAKIAARCSIHSWLCYKCTVNAGRHISSTIQGLSRVQITYHHHTGSFVSIQHTLLHPFHSIPRTHTHTSAAWKIPIRKHQRTLPFQRSWKGLVSVSMILCLAAINLALAEGTHGDTTLTDSASCVSIFFSTDKQYFPW